MTQGNQTHQTFPSHTPIQVNLLKRSGQQNHVLVVCNGLTLTPTSVGLESCYSAVPLLQHRKKTLKHHLPFVPSYCPADLTSSVKVMYRDSRNCCLLILTEMVLAHKWPDPVRIFKPLVLVLQWRRIVAGYSFQRSCFLRKGKFRQF